MDGFSLEPVGDLPLEEGVELPQAHDPSRGGMQSAGNGHVALIGVGMQLGGTAEVLGILLRRPVGPADLVAGVELDDPGEADDRGSPALRTQKLHPRPRLIHGCTVQLLSAASIERIGMLSTLSATLNWDG